MQNPADGRRTDARVVEALRASVKDNERLRERNRELTEAAAEPIAVVAMSCRYPGGVTTPEQLWDLLVSERDTASDFPGDRDWDLRDLFDDDPDQPGRSYTRRASFLDDPAGFDAPFFGISPKEALAMDPQQRLLLECSWEALERAGIDPTTLRGTRTGVFAGVVAVPYGPRAVDAADGSEGHLVTGTAPSVASGRIAYALGLEGPAVSVDTACSSSLTALDIAVSALRRGECDRALVGGVSVVTDPSLFAGLSGQRALSPDGRSKAFDAAADGTGWSEGCGVLVVERLSEARRLGHPVLALVRGLAINQDGASGGLTAPNGSAQRRVIERALEVSGVTADQVDAVEAHGTGTALGDPIEAEALIATYGRARTAADPLRLGSLKSNIGHTVAAAGISGVIKMVLALRHETLPRTLHLEEPTPRVDWSAGTVVPLRGALPWPRRRGRPRRAAVSAFGMSGTNAHVILEEAPAERDSPAPEGSPGPDSPAARQGRADHAAPAPTGVLPWPLSARGSAALAAQAARLGAHLDARPGLAAADVGHTLTTARADLPDRAVVLAADEDGFRAGLRALADGDDSEHVVRGRVGERAKTALVFPGQGSQWIGMAVPLLDTVPEFAATVEACEKAFAPHLDWSLTAVLRGEPGAPPLERVDVVQPVLFTVMVALAGLWRSHGLRPSAVIGHSQGEIAAAHVAGVLTLEDAALVVAVRSRLLTSLVGTGAMAVLALSAEEAAERVRPWEGRISVAVVNGPGTVVVAGDQGPVAELAAACEAEGIRTRRIHEDVAGHSPHVDALRDDLLAALDGVRPRPASVPLWSTVTGERVDGTGLDARHWFENLRRTVLFAPGILSLHRAGFTAFVEVSSHPVTTYGIQQTVEAAGDDTAAVLHTLRRGEGGHADFLAALARAHVRGVPVDWSRVYAPHDPRTVDLPTYAFQRERYWLAPARSADVAGSGADPVAHPLLGASVDLPGTGGRLFTGQLSLREHPWLADHAVGDTVVLPGAAHLDLVLHAAEQVGHPVVSELTLRAPLVLTRDADVRIHVETGAPDADDRRAVRVHARPADRPDGWTLYAEGTLERAGDGDDADTGPWPPPGARSVPVAALYDDLAGDGYGYGPAFRGLRTAWRDGDDVWAEVELPAAQRGDAAGFGLHPALLDAALHTVALSVRGSDGEPGRVHLPFEWTGVRLHAAGARSLRVRAGRVGPNAYDLVATDPSGAPVLSARALEVRPVEVAQVARDVRRTRRRELYALEWPTADLSGAAALPAVAVLGEDPAGVTAALSRAGIVVHPLTRLDQLRDLSPDVPVLAPFAAPVPGDPAARDAAPPGDTVGEGTTPGDRPAPSHSVLGRGLARLQGWMTPGDVPDARAGAPARETPDAEPERPANAVPAQAVGPEGWAAAAHTALGRCLALLQEWTASEDTADRRLVVLTRGAVAASPGEQVADVVHASLWGMLRSAQAEQPDRFTVVDLDGSDAAAATLGRVLASGEPQAALRGAVARVPRLAEAAPGGHGRPLAADGGTVLITGATGALGSAVARHLAAHHGVRDLLLLSRRGGESPGARSLAADLADLGARARFAACDVTDPGALADVIASVPDDRPLRAVVHAAGGIDDGVLSSQTPESLGRVLRPKADAALHLHRLTAHLRLDAFVLFSSAAGVLGSPGQTNYAAANTLLDGLARYRRSLGLAGQSLAWGLWEELGEAGRHLDEGDVSRLRRLGMARVLPREEALDLLDAALDSEEPYLVPLPVDLAGLRSRAARTGRVPHLFRGLVRPPRRRASAGDAGGSGLAGRLAALGEPERVRLLADLVGARTAEVLGRPEGEAIDPEQDFLELGMDSLTAVELRNDLREATGLRLAASVVLTHSSPARLARHLAQALPAPGAAARPAPEPAEEDPLAGVVALFRQACRQGRVADGIALVQAASHLRPVFTGPETFGPPPAPVTLARGPVGPRLVCLPSLVMVSGAQEYARFAGALQGRRHVTVLPQPGFTPGDPLPRTLEDAVALQALAVRAVVGDDEPYVLVSRSSGGWMTHAVTTRLEAEGRAPLGVVLMDTPMPDEPTALPIIQAGVLERETRFGLMDDTRVTAMGRYIDLCRDWTPAPTKVPTLAVRPGEQMRDGAGAPIGGADWRFEWPLPHDALDAGGDHITMLEEHGAATARAVDAWIVERGL